MLLQETVQMWNIFIETGLLQRQEMKEADQPVIT